jgi:hypothetical protein
MEAIRDYEATAAELVYESGSRAGTELEFVQDRVVVDELAVIEKRVGVYLLKALTDIPVEVSGELVTEKILQLGDHIVVGPVRIEFRRRHSAELREQARRLLRIVLSVLAAMTALLLLVDLWHQLGALAPSKDIASQPFVRERPPRDEARVVEQIAAARLAFAAAERYQAEAGSVESYQFKAARLFDSVIHEVEGIEPAPPIAALAQERLDYALRQLRSRLEYLKKNAHVAHSVSEDEDLRLILQEIMATIPDPANEEYWQWAWDKLDTMGAS